MDPFLPAPAKVECREEEVFRAGKRAEIGDRRMGGGDGVHASHKCGWAAKRSNFECINFGGVAISVTSRT